MAKSNQGLISPRISDLPDPFAATFSSCQFGQFGLAQVFGTTRPRAGVALALNAALEPAFALALDLEPALALAPDGRWKDGFLWV